MFNNKVITQVLKKGRYIPIKTKIHANYLHGFYFEKYYSKTYKVLG